MNRNKGKGIRKPASFLMPMGKGFALLYPSSFYHKNKILSRRKENLMQYKMDGYYKNDVACVYGYDSKGHKVMIYKGYFNYKQNTVTLYPFSRLAPTSDPIAKVTIPITKLGREGVR